MLNFTVNSWLFDDSQLPPGFVEPFRNTQEAVFLAHKIREALDQPNHVFNITLQSKEGFAATTQELVAALNKAGASVGPLLPRLPTVRRALAYVEEVVNYLRVKQDTGKCRVLSVDPDWYQLLLDCFHEVHRAAETNGTKLAQGNDLATVATDSLSSGGPGPETASTTNSAGAALADDKQPVRKSDANPPEEPPGGWSIPNSPKMDQPDNSLRKVGEVWHLRYQGESGDYPVRGNQSIGWLEKVLAAPNRCLTVADLRGDPEGKLTADALLSGLSETDQEGVKRIKTRLAEIEEIISQTGGWSESLENEQADLLRRVQEADDKKQITSPLQTSHHNMATQIRAFLRNKLAKDMPSLGAHLTAALKFDFPHFGYFPPASTPAWKI